MRILILGGGYMGTRLFELLSKDNHVEKLFWDERFERIKFYHHLRTNEYEIVLNCIGKTGKPNIDWCENNKADTFESNVLVPMRIAETCKRLNQYWIHLSTGCIYRGEGFDEFDKPNFVESYYSYSKVEAEKNIKMLDSECLILRIRMPVDCKPHERNFIDKITKYDKLINEPNSITIVEDLAMIIEKLGKEKFTGIVHATNPGSICHKDVIDLYREFVDKDFKEPEWISMEQLDKLTKSGRSNCVLNTRTLTLNVPNIKPAKQRLIETMIKYGLEVLETGGNHATVMREKTMHAEIGLGFH